MKTEHTLLGTTDAMIWAEEFCRIFKGFTITDVPQDVHGIVDQGGMVAWFASAIETGRNFGRKELCPHGELHVVSEDMRLCIYCGKAFYGEEESPIVTKTGKVLTDDDIQALADEAEQGYDVEKLKERKRE